MNRGLRGHYRCCAIGQQQCGDRRPGAPKHAFPHAFHNGADFILAGMFDWQIAEDVAVAKAAFADAYTKRDRPWQS